MSYKYQGTHSMSHIIEDTFLPKKQKDPRKNSTHFSQKSIPKLDEDLSFLLNIFGTIGIVIIIKNGMNPNS